MNIIIEVCLFKLVLVPNFSWNWQFWIFRPDLPKKVFSGLKQKKWIPYIFYIILHIKISLVRNFSSNYQFYFLDQICRKTEKVNIIIEFRIFKLVSWYQISALTDDFDFFWPGFSKKGFSGLKLKKLTPHIFYIILQISLVRNLSSNWQFWFFGPNLWKRYLQSKTKKVKITLELCIFELV